jgi:hypothetical protein
MMCSCGVVDLMSGVEDNYIVRADTKLGCVHRKEAVRRCKEASKEAYWPG